MFLSEKKHLETHFVNKGARAGVSAGVGSTPKSRADVEGAELVGVHEGIDVRLLARAVVREGRVVVGADVREVAEHGAVARVGVPAEPGAVVRRRRVVFEVRERG